MSRLLRERALGASDLAAALARLEPGGATRVLLHTDAVVTAGDTARASLRSKVKELEAHVKRVDVVLDEGAGDRELAEALTKGGGRVHSGALSASELATRLGTRLLGEFGLEVEGADWVYPERLSAVEPGEVRTVYARLNPEARQDEVQYQLSSRVSGTTRRRLAVRRAEPLLLERSVAAAEIRRLMAERDAPGSTPEDQSALSASIIQLSKRYRVLSDWTAFLVLESDADYQRYQLDRNALGDIVTIGNGGLKVLERTHQEAPPEAQGDAEPKHKRGAAFRMGKGLGPRSPDRQLSWHGAIEAAPPGPDCAQEPHRCPRRFRKPERTYEFEDDVLAFRFEARESPHQDNALAVRRTEGPAEPGARWSEREVRELLRHAPYTGRLAEVMALIARGDAQRALVQALSWRDQSPIEVPALIALGEALEANGDRQAAARVYGSFIDLYPSRAEMRRFAAGRLERLGPWGTPLAEDAYRKALASRPDLVTGHQLLAYSLLRQRRYEEAFAVLERLQARYGIERPELREDVRLFASILSARGVAERRVERLLERLDLTPLEGPSTRVLLTWETDANDVDLHLLDRQGRHAYYEAKTLPRVGRLLRDETAGFGPEEFVFLPDANDGPYRLLVHYYNRGPMGYGMGKLDIVSHDGDGNVKIETRPFFMTVDRSTVDLGAVGG